MPGKQVHRSWRNTRTVCRGADAWLKHSLVGNLDALVALALIVMLLLGSLVLTGFLTVRIGQSACWKLPRSASQMVVMCGPYDVHSALLLGCLSAPACQVLNVTVSTLFTPSPSKHVQCYLVHLQSTCTGKLCIAKHVFLHRLACCKSETLAGTRIYGHVGV